MLGNCSQQQTPNPQHNNLNTTGARRDKRRKKLKPTNEAITKEGNNETYNSERMSFKFILDSATLFNILIGQNVCKDPNLTIYFDNITNKVNKWLNKGRNISSLGGDPFEWRPRTLNYGADIQCETVLDNCLSFVEKHRNSMKLSNMVQTSTSKAMVVVGTWDTVPLDGEFVLSALLTTSA